MSLSRAQLNEIYQDTEQRKSVSSIWVSVNRRFNQGLAFIAGISLIMMMLLIVSNAVIRVFADPFAGTVEVVGWLMAITTSFAIGYTQLNRGHVDIDLLTSRFSPMVQRGLQATVQLVSMLFFLVVGWQVIQYGLSLMKNGTLSQTLGVIFYPYVFLVSLGFFGTSFTLAVQLYETWTGGEKRGA